MRVRRSTTTMCERNAKCEEIAPEVFQVSEDDDLLKLLQERPGEDFGRRSKRRSGSARSWRCRSRRSRVAIRGVGGRQGGS